MGAPGNNMWYCQVILDSSTDLWYNLSIERSRNLMKLTEAMKTAGDCGKISRPCFPIYPDGVEVWEAGDRDLVVECDFSIKDLEADDWEVV